MSIWQFTDRRTFEVSVDRLHSLGSRHEPVSLHQKPDNIWRVRNKRLYHLPYGVELRLAEDFALLAAWSTASSCVTAASVAPGIRGRGLRISIAANDGVPDLVVEAFGRIFKNLERCASRAIQEDECAELCCGEVVALQENRILSRIKTAKTHNKPRRPVSDELRQLATLLERHDDGLQPQRNRLIDQVRTLIKALDKVSHTTSATHCETQKIRLSKIIKAAHDVVFDDTSSLSFDESVQDSSLEKRLQGLGWNEENRQRREGREVHALATYWRICRYLSACAAYYPQCFAKLNLNRVRIRGNGKRFVHAEIQLLLDHESTANLPRPRVIPASKMACWLCHSFIQAYGNYEVSRCHGEVHPKWYIPDKIGYQKRVRVSIANALRDMGNLIDDAISTRRRLRGVYKPQSIINLVIHRLQKASLASIRTFSKTSTPLATVVELFPGTEQNEEATLQVAKLDPESNAEAAVSPLSIGGAEAALEEDMELADASRQGQHGADKVLALRDSVIFDVSDQPAPSYGFEAQPNNDDADQGDAACKLARLLAVRSKKNSLEAPTRSAMSNTHSASRVDTSSSAAMRPSEAWQNLGTIWSKRTVQHRKDPTRSAPSSSNKNLSESSRWHQGWPSCTIREKMVEAPVQHALSNPLSAVQVDAEKPAAMRPSQVWQNLGAMRSKRAVQHRKDPTRSAACNSHENMSESSRWHQGWTSCAIREKTVHCVQHDWLELHFLIESSSVVGASRSSRKHADVVRKGLCHVKSAGAGRYDGSIVDLSKLKSGGEDTYLLAKDAEHS